MSDTRLTREYELARDLVDAASLDIIRQNAEAARFGGAAPVIALGGAAPSAARSR